MLLFIAWISFHVFQWSEPKFELFMGADSLTMHR
jgi:hypothetical protein